MKKLFLATAIVLFSGIANAASVEATIVGPSTYSESLWESVCIANAKGPTDFIATVIICPNDLAEPVPIACIPHSVTSATLPPAAQAIVNYMIAQWYTGTDPITGLPNSRYAP